MDKVTFVVIFMIEMSYLPRNFLIKTPRNSITSSLLGGGKPEDIFLLRALRIKNISKEKISIQELRFSLKSNGNVQQIISFPKEMLAIRAEKLSKIGEFIGTVKSNPEEEKERIIEFKNVFGEEPFWDFGKLTDKMELKPLDETGLWGKTFKACLSDPVDEMEITVVFEMNGEVKTSSISVPIKEYSSKNEYIFPLKGACLVWGNWDITINSHRLAHSQEFGMDFVYLNDDLTFPHTVKTKNEDFKTYRKDVYAVYDGEVIDVFDKAPENPIAPDTFPPEKQEEIKKKYGWHAIAMGNYIIIKHPNDEYSGYAHLSTGSATVKKGDKVKQGQVIGKVGNAGHSAGPHLHFQIINGPDFLTARGLPCHFVNIVDFMGKDVSLIQDNLVIVHTKE